MEKTLEKKKIKTYRDFNVFQQAMELASEIFKISARFPTEERYALIDQIRRAARSIPANLAEGWGKRNYENVFKRHLYDCIGSCEEVQVWLEIALRCNYLNRDKYELLRGRYAEVGAMLGSLANRWQTF